MILVLMYAFVAIGILAIALPILAVLAAAAALRRLEGAEIRPGFAFHERGYGNALEGTLGRVVKNHPWTSLFVPILFSAAMVVLWFGGYRAIFAIREISEGSDRMIRSGQIWAVPASVSLGLALLASVAWLVRVPLGRARRWLIEVYRP